MRSSLLPKRPLRRVCDACKQKQQRQRQHLNPTTKNFSHAAGITATAPSRTSHPLADPRLAACRAQGIRRSNPPQQTRTLSSNAHAATSESRNAAAPDEGAEETPPPPPPPPPQAKSSPTHYDLFPQTLPAGPPPAGPFAIDTRALRREFLTLQATAHPDVAPAGPPKRRAEAASARINDAYRTLTHPLSRAQYLLSLRGIDVAGEETARVEDPALLTLVLETREAVEEADAEAALEPLREENEGRIRESEDRLARAFAEDDLEAARHEVTRLRYWVNIRESIHNWERGKPVVLEH
ncbi:hypothetical protein Hte_004512 [Hypoxylon texense]